MGAAKTEWKEEIEQIEGSNLGRDNSWELVGGEMVWCGGDGRWGEAKKQSGCLGFSGCHTRGGKNLLEG